MPTDEIDFPLDEFDGHSGFGGWQKFFRHDVEDVPDLVKRQAACVGDAEFRRAIHRKFREFRKNRENRENRVC